MVNTGDNSNNFNVFEEKRKKMRSKRKKNLTDPSKPMSKDDIIENTHKYYLNSGINDKLSNNLNI